MKYITGFFKGIWNFIMQMAEGRQRYLERHGMNRMY
jgi:hypothetical protein